MQSFLQKKFPQLLFPVPPNSCGTDDDVLSKIT